MLHSVVAVCFDKDDATTAEKKKQEARERKHKKKLKLRLFKKKKKKSTVGEHGSGSHAHNTSDTAAHDAAFVARNAVATSVGVDALSTHSPAAAHDDESPKAGLSPRSWTAERLEGWGLLVLVGDGGWGTTRLAPFPVLPSW